MRKDNVGNQTGGWLNNGMWHFNQNRSFHSQMDPKLFYFILKITKVAPKTMSDILATNVCNFQSTTWTATDCNIAHAKIHPKGTSFLNSNFNCMTKFRHGCSIHSFLYEPAYYIIFLVFSLRIFPVNFWIFHWKYP